MNIRELFDKKKCVFSFEMFPPKKESADMGAMLDTVNGLKKLSPDYISITYGAGGKGGKNTAMLASAVKAASVEPLAHITCMGSDESDINDALKNLTDCGVENVMALRGDRVEGIKEGSFRYASQLVEYIKKVNPALNVAGACYPEGHVEAKNRFEDIKNLRLKVEAGVTHLNSQLFFDNEDFFEFIQLIRLAGIDVPVQAGIMPVVKVSQVDRIISLAGVKIPSKLSRLLSKYGSDPVAIADAGIAYATEQIADLIAGGVDGIHVYVMNNVATATRIAENVKSLIARVNEGQ